MRIALYIAEGLDQIVLQPDTKEERRLLDKLHDDGRSLEVKRGHFFECRGGFIRQAGWPGYQSDLEDTMIVLRPATHDEADILGEAWAGGPSGHHESISLSTVAEADTARSRMGLASHQIRATLGAVRDGMDEAAIAAFQALADNLSDGRPSLLDELDGAA